MWKMSQQMCSIIIIIIIIIIKIFNRGWQTATNTNIKEDKNNR